MPPPNVNGIVTCSATRAATSTAETPRVDRRRDVEEHELVGAGVRVRGAELDRVADVAQALELDALDDAAARDVEARDQARERHRSRKRAPAAPLFSGWNCTPVNDAVLDDRRDALARRDRRVGLRPRTSARTSTPRRPARPAPSRCAARARRAAGPRGPGRARARRRRRPPRSRRARAAGRGRCRGSACPRRAARAARRRSARRRPVHRRARGADARAGSRGRRPRRRRSSSAPSRRERELDRADVARAVARRSRRSQDPLRRRDERALGANRGAQRAADRLERRLGDVMRIVARRLDVDAHARRCRRGSGACASRARGRAARSIADARRPPRSTAARASASSIGTTASP